jgi:multidrug efflux pump subunit AcrB
MSLIAIPKESSPDIKFGIINIATVYLGVSPTDMDQLITDEIEQAIKDIDGIKKISSSSRVGVSSVTAELENSADINNVLIDINDEVDKTQLPSEAEDPFVLEISSENEAMFSLILYGDKKLTTPASLKQLARIVKDSLNNVQNVSSIDIQGGDTFDIQLILDKGKKEQM